MALPMHKATKLADEVADLMWKYRLNVAQGLDLMSLVTLGLLVQCDDPVAAGEDFCAVLMTSVKEAKRQGIGR